MAKAKNKGAKRITNPHLHARVAYLHRASKYLATLSLDARDHGLVSHSAAESTARQTTPTPAQQLSRRASFTEVPQEAMSISQSSSRHLAGNLRSVARKSQIRLASNIKSSICRVCNAVLIEGQTVTTTVENKSRGGQKPWAEVSCMACHACGTVKRFPIGATRQSKKAIRIRATSDKPQQQTHDRHNISSNTGLFDQASQAVHTCSTSHACSASIGGQSIPP